MLPRSLLLGLLLTAPLLAGCLDSVPGLGGPGLTARDAANRALPRAQQWHADAVLLTVAATEARAGGPLESGNSSITFGSGPFPGPDPNVGDGRAPAWYLGYASPSANRTMEVVVFANGTVLADESDDDTEDETPIGDWQVDSPRAVEVAMQDANFSRAARAADGALVEALSGAEQDDSGGSPFGNDPFWVLIANSPSESTGGMVFVNARTGERIAMPFPFGPFGAPMFPPGFPFTGGSAPERCDEETEMGGSTGAAGSSEHFFSVDDGCVRMDLEVEWQSTSPTDRVEVQVLDPDGDVLEPEEESAEGTTYTARFRVGEAGDHELRVQGFSETPAGGAPVAVNVRWQARIQLSG